MMAESGNAPVREAMARLERRFEQDKITALGRDITTVARWPKYRSYYSKKAD